MSPATGSPRPPSTIGVVVMAYGTPSSEDELDAYYTDIRRGRPPTAEQLADLRRRYDAIGGLSPLTRQTEAQAAGLARSLADLGSDIVVAVGYRHVEPSIELAVAELADAGVTTLVGLVLAPHYSQLSVARYHERAVAAATERGLDYRPIDSWGTAPAYVSALADAVADELAELPADTTVVFTAHSLPSRIVALGDPYPAELTATAVAVAGAAGLGADRWELAWQSAGRTPEPWLEPDILARVDALAAAGRDGMLVCPCGFVSEHLEVLFDLDIEAAQRAETAGIAFARTPTVGADTAVLDCLAARVVSVAAR